MSSADWNEIKRLAADFQRAQLTSSLQRLSERNCVEIINKLVELKLIEVFYTSDGKEYITPSQLIKEMKEELHHQGRINLTDLCKLLMVDLTLLEKKASDVASADGSIHLVLGQLISESYLNIIAEEINEKLQQKGSITIAELAKTYDLPGDFLLRVITKRLGKSIKGQQDEGDPQTFFTDTFVARHQYQIKGALMAITHPTPVANIVSLFHFQERLFFGIAEKMIANESVQGSLSGGRILTQAIYIPKIYSKAQHDWVESFLKQNGYLEFEALQRLGISDPAGYIKKYFSNYHLTFVPGACVGQLFIDQLDANLEEALVSGHYVDVTVFLPLEFSSEVCSYLIRHSLKTREETAKSTGCANIKCHIFCDTFVVSENLFMKIAMTLEELMPSKAQEMIDKGIFKQQLTASRSKGEEESSRSKKEERRKKAAGGKAGGGTQGRETKTKSTKGKKGKRGVAHLSDEEEAEKSSTDIEFLPLHELKDELSKFLEFEDSPEELLEAIAEHMHDPLTKKFQEVAKNAYLSIMASSGDKRKQSHQLMQDKVTLLLSTARLAEKGIKEFSDDTELQLTKYLLRTHCSEIVNQLVLYLAIDAEIDIKDDKDISLELRLKIINKLSDDIKPLLLAIHKSLTAPKMEPFMASIDDALAAAGVLIKKKDNKKDRQSLLSHRTGLIDQLNASLSAAVTLHLVCLVLFQAVTGNLLHASGKFVPQILGFLKLHLPQETLEVLQEYQGLVMKTLSMKCDGKEQSSVHFRIEELTPKVKDICISYRRPKRDNSISED